MTLFVFTACTNEDAIIDDQQTTEESGSITTALNRLSNQFDDYGNVTESDNPSGNIVFDFCFDFVYPLTLSYNNDATVTVDDLDGLIEIMINSTEDLYITGIAFPFNVEVYNDSTNAIEVETINNEEEFVALIEDCAFGDIEICECPEIYDPVCVQITDPNGDTFTITYPNACYAECDGFTEADFAENCEDDYYAGGNECFIFNFPLSIITEDGETITINAEADLETALYGVYAFDFVYPFTVTLENGDEATINSGMDIESLLENCYGDIGGNDCEECENQPIDVVCVESVNPDGTVEIISFPNLCTALCLGFTEDDVVECDDDTNPSYCSEEELANYLVECVWFGASSLNPNNNNGIFTFNADGTVSVAIEGNTITGTWSLASNPATAQVFMFISLPEPYVGVSNLDWTVTACNETFVGLESNNEFVTLERVCE